jgi:hypothetical protein
MIKWILTASPTISETENPAHKHGEPNMMNEPEMILEEMDPPAPELSPQEKVEKWKALAENTKKLIALKEQSIRLLDQLRFLYEVGAQGIDPATVRGYGFDHTIERKKLKGEIQRHLHDNAFVHHKTESGIINVVFLKTGERIELETPLRRPAKEKETKE